MRYSLHPESERDLRDAAEFYKERAGTALSLALLTEFEFSIQLPVQHPLPGTLAQWKAPSGHEALPLLGYLYCLR
ncbi:hypothetical protein GALL_273360 [mine drainage metagenome]|uniref:Plasmid stabilization system protein n=1 Tax=mine drainage metagenome TaxID=410659 RepID=A0A1J5RMP3_9ZZZZ